MNQKHPHLATLIQAQSVLERVAQRHHISTRAVRVVGALQLIPHRTTTEVSHLLGCHYETALAGVNQALEAGWIVYGANTWRLSLTLAGLGIYRTLESAEQAARRGIAQPAKGPKPRKYVRSGKYIGRGVKKLSE